MNVFITNNKYSFKQSGFSVMLFDFDTDLFKGNWTLGCWSARAWDNYS